MKQLADPTDHQIAQAGQVLKAIKQLDPGFFNADMDMARAWARILGPSDYTTPEMLAGVLEFYKHETRGRRCMPANVLQGAKAAREAHAATPQGKKQLEARRKARRAELDRKIEAAKDHKPKQLTSNTRPLPPEVQEKLNQLIQGVTHDAQQHKN